MKNGNNPIEKTLLHTGLSQEKLAEQLGVSRQTIVNYMADPDKIPHAIINELLKITGFTYEMLFGAIEKADGPKIAKHYKKLVEDFNKRMEDAKNQFELLQTLKIDKRDESLAAEQASMKDEFYNIVKIAKEQAQKITVCAFGESDTGKSTIINQLLHNEIAPVNYSPITSTITYFRHISEKPPYLNEDESAVVFGREKESSLEKFEHYYLEEESIAEPYIIREGDYQSILQAFGTRNGAYFNNDKFLIEEIDVFLDNDILEEMTLIDIPGFGSDIEEDNIGLVMDMSKFDIILYLSLSNGFFRSEDIIALKQILKNRQDLDSIYILATHANAIGNPDKVMEIIENGCMRFIRSMTEKELSALHITENADLLKKRCFGYDVFNNYYAQRFNQDFERVVSELNQKRVEKAKIDLQTVCISLCEKYNTKHMQLNAKVLQDKNPKEQEKFLYQMETDNQKLIDTIKQSLKECRSNTKERLHKEYDQIINQDFLLKVIEKKGIRNKKSDKGEFLSYINSEVNDRFSENIRENSQIFSEKLNEFLKNYEKLWNMGYQEKKITIDMSNFDFVCAFTAGLASVKAYGALTVWATSAAAGSNLGEYILSAKVVSCLSMMGVSIGAPSAVSAFVASIGGTVVLPVAKAVFSAMSAIGTLSGNWKARFVKTLIQNYEKKGFQKKCQEHIDKYWNDTEKAWNACLNSLSEKSIAYYKYQMEKEALEDSIRENINQNLDMTYRMMMIIYSRMCEETV